LGDEKHHLKHLLELNSRVLSDAALLVFIAPPAALGWWLFGKRTAKVPSARQTPQL
jgi:hypothetical protein